jgi:hypothetical protein
LATWPSRILTWMQSMKTTGYTRRFPLVVAIQR